MGFDLNGPFGEDVIILGQGELDALGIRSLDFSFLTEREEFISRILRRLLTSPGEWIVFPNYGAGLRSLVNETLTFELIDQVKRIVMDQIFREADVERNPEPVIEVKGVGDSLVVSIKVFSKPIGLVAFSFDPRLV